MGNRYTESVCARANQQNKPFPYFRGGIWLKTIRMHIDIILLKFIYLFVYFAECWNWLECIVTGHGLGDREEFP